MKQLWQKLCEAENVFLKTQGAQRNKKREDFGTAQKYLIENTGKQRELTEKIKFVRLKISVLLTLKSFGTQ